MKNIFSSVKSAYDFLMEKCDGPPYFDNSPECLIFHSGDYEIDGRICSAVIYKNKDDDRYHIVFVPLAGYDGKKHLRAA
jgi:hypothetical protein